MLKVPSSPLSPSAAAWPLLDRYTSESSAGSVGEAGVVGAEQVRAGLAGVVVEVSGVHGRAVGLGRAGVVGAVRGPARRGAAMPLEVREGLPGEGLGAVVAVHDLQRPAGV